MVRERGREGGVRAYLDLGVGDGVTADSGVSGTVDLLVENVLAPSVPVCWVDILHSAGLADIGVVVALKWLGDQVTQQDQRAGG